MEMNLERIRSLFDTGLRDWSLNASELSGWIRLLAPLLLWIGALRRSYRQLLSVFAFVIVSPYIFSPRGEDSWMNRAMRGEQEWLLRNRVDANTFISLAWVGLLKLSLFTGLLRKFWISLLFLLSSTIVSVWHHDRMATQFENERSLEDVQGNQDEDDFYIEPDEE
jgi:Family of unknown function (DUF6653)